MSILPGPTTQLWRTVSWRSGRLLAGTPLHSPIGRALQAKSFNVYTYMNIVGCIELRRCHGQQLDVNNNLTGARATTLDCPQLVPQNYS